MVGKTISHYEIIEKLGQGGMGEVYKARDLNLDRFAAVKLLPQHASADDPSRQRLLREARAVSVLDHQNICTFYEAGQTENGVPFIAMAYYEGLNLRQHMGGRPLHLSEALGIAVSVGEGLSKAHEKGIIHRDIKPENIIITNEGVVKIMDFGLARTTGVTSLTAEGITVGTMAYMSPEQLRGEKVDNRTDLWSLGALLYEMVAGRAPFVSEYEEALAYALANEDPDPITSLRSGIPMELEHIVKKLLSKNPRDRYQHVEDVIVDLRRIHSSLPSRSISAQPMRKRILQWGFGSAALLTLIVALWLYHYFTSSRQTVVTVLEPAPKEQPLAEQPRRTDEPQKEVTGNKQKTFGRASKETPPQLSAQTADGRKTSQPSPTDGSSIENISVTNRIAVIPLDNFSENKDDEYFADGMTEELISTLSKVGGLRVIARTSVVQYKSLKKTAAEIGRTLNVAALLEGSVRKSGQRVRISVQMVNTRTEEQLWSESYDREIKDIFEIQREVAENVAKSMQLQLASGEIQQLENRRVENLDAYTLYLKGRYHWNQRAPSNLMQSIEFFQKSIAADSQYSLAYAGLADTYTILGNFYIIPQQEAYPKAKQASSKALSLDPSLSQAHAALAFAILHYDWDLAKAEESLKKAISTNPSNAVAQSWYGYTLAIAGRFNEALPFTRRAETLDPLSPVIKLDAAITLYFARQYDLAIEKINESLRLDPSFFLAYIPLAGCYVQTSQFEEAARVLRKAKNLSGNHPVPSAALGYVLARQGKKEDALRVVRELRSRSGKTFVPSYWIALIYVALGEPDQALESLEKAFDQRDVSMVFLKVDPILDPLRTNPRFIVLMDKMRL